MKAQSQKRLRQIHRWLGLFFAPAILFFALSGTLQALGFQDRARSYQPPAWIALIANIHKHGVMRSAKAPPAPAQRPTPPAVPKRDTAKVLSPFSIFAALLGLLLAAATGLGIWIGLLNQRERLATLVLLLAGVCVPVLLLMA